MYKSILASLSCLMLVMICGCSSSGPADECFDCIRPVQKCSEGATGLVSRVCLYYDTENNYKRRNIKDEWIEFTLRDTLFTNGWKLFDGIHTIPLPDTLLPYYLIYSHVDAPKNSSATSFKLPDNTYLWNSRPDTVKLINSDEITVDSFLFK